MTGTEAIIWGAVALVGVGGSALCSATEIGLYTVNRVRLKIAARDESRRGVRALERELARPERPLITLLISNTVFNNLGALGITGVLTGAGLGDASVIALNAIVLTPLLLVFAEILPKEISRAEADKLMPVLIGPLRAARIMMGAVGLLALVQGVSTLAERLLGFRPQISEASGREATAALLKEGRGSGIPSESQPTLLDRALALRSASVRGVMQAWSGARTVGVDWSGERAIRFVSRFPHTRFPVVDARGHVVGVVELRRICLERGRPIRELMTEPTWVGAGDSVRDALRSLVPAPGDRGGLAIVGAGQGSGGPGGARRPVGLVTRRDLCEPLTDLGPMGREETQPAAG